MNQQSIDFHEEPQLPCLLKQHIAYFGGDYPAWLKEQVAQYGEKSTWPKYLQQADDSNLETLRRLKYWTEVWCA